MKERITIKITLDRDKNEISRFQSNAMTIDSNGNILDETEFNEDSSIACKRIYRYFDDGTVKEYVEYDPKDQLIERHTYIHNDDGYVEKVVYEYGDGHKIIKEFSLSELGMADTTTLYDEENSIIGYESCVYNENGDATARTEFDEERVETVKYTSTYDDNGNASVEEKFIDGKLVQVTSHIYDSNDNLVMKEVIDKTHGTKHVDEYNYDDKGNMVHNVSFHNGALVFENKCTYDQDGQLETEEFFEIDFWEKRVTRHERLLHMTPS